MDAASATTAGALAAAAAQTLKQKAAELHSQRLSGLALQMQREPSVAVNPLQAVKELGMDGKWRWMSRGMRMVLRWIWKRSGRGISESNQVPKSS